MCWEYLPDLVSVSNLFTHKMNKAHSETIDSGLTIKFRVLLFEDSDSWEVSETSLLS